MNELIFVRLFWKQKPVHPVLQLTPIGLDRFSELPIKIGDEINFKITNSQYCIGTEISSGKWITCLSHQKQFDESATMDNIVEGSINQCFLCSKNSFFQCRMRCQGIFCNPSSDKAKEICTPPNTYVYLTHVGGSLKVGVSTNLQRRWLEQGSDYSVAIAKGSGLEARRLEKLLSDELSLKMQVRGNTKLRNYIPPKFDDINNEFLYKITEMNSIISEFQSNNPSISQLGGKLVDLTINYGELETNRPFEIIDVKPDNEFGGIIVSIKGSIVVTQKGRYYYAMDFNKLSGLTIEFLEREAVIKTQLALDDWF